MSFLGKFNFCLGALVLAGVLNGCSPTDPGQLDEEKEPHYSLGKSRVNAMDYAGAIEAFQESLEVNPHSAAAHFQLACLFDTKESDPAAAIYHYQEYVRLNPQADNAEVIRQRIYSCKQQLAADVLPLPSAPATMKQIEDLTEKNRRLQDEVDKWRAYYAAQQAAAQASPARTPEAPAQTTSLTPDDISVQTGPAPTASQATATAGGTKVRPGAGARPAPPKIPKPRTHIVAAGETMASIARRHGVNLRALQAANPGVNPKKLRAGQTLTLPAS